MYRIGLGVIGLLASFNAYAMQTIADIADRLIVGGDIVTRLLWVVCVVMGVSLIILAVTLYQGHRRNPKLVPLGKPVLYLVLGVVVVGIPFLDYFFGETGHALLKAHRPMHTLPQDADTPVEEWGNDFGH